MLRCSKVQSYLLFTPFILQDLDHFAHCCLDLLFGLVRPLPQYFFLAKLHLFSAVEHSFSKLSRPLSAQMVNINPISVHQVIFPLSLVMCSIGEGKLSPAVVFIIQPLSAICRSIWVSIRAKAFHPILLPISLVPFLASLALCLQGERHLSEAMLHLDSFDELPVAFVDNPIQILIPSIAHELMRKWLRLYFFRRFLHSILGVFFRTHLYN